MKREETVKPYTGCEDRETEKVAVRLSVRAFVEFLLRSGDLEAGRGGWAEREAMQAGAQAHRKIQKSRGSGYRAEVPLCWVQPYPEYDLVIEGRADGIYEEDGMPVIEEIKGTYQDVQHMQEAFPLHLAQARCYAFLYAHDGGYAQIRICMTYVQLDEQVVRQFRSEESAESLTSWFLALVESYRKWSDFRISWQKIRDASIRELDFPFPYREGQKKLVADIYRTILREKQIFVQAPTGVGKTISMLYPSIRAMGEQLISRVFYLTAKTTTRAVAEETFDILQGGGLSCKSLTLTSKEKICLQEEAACDPYRCPYAKGHFDRINEVLYHTLCTYDKLDRRTLQETAREGCVCPYELQSDLTVFADLVLGDYNHAFDPDARLRSFFGEGRMQKDSVFLIDEAHNLVDRARDMFSADLSREEFLSLRRQYKERKEPVYRKLCSSLQSCGKILLDYRKEWEVQKNRDSVQELILPLLALSGRLEDVLSEQEEGQEREQLLLFYFRISTFLSIHELFDEKYIVYGYPAGRYDFFLKLFCVDPSTNLQRTLDRVRATVFFSATLIPVRYYRSLLSGRVEDYAIAVPSPFSEKNRRILIGMDVSTLYQRRTETEYARIAAYIKAAVSCRSGHYMVYFPSYQMMEDLAGIYRPLLQENETLLIQKKEMSEAEKEAFIRAFHDTGDQEDGGHTLTGFCVMGGVFSEGIDLRGEALIGAVIVGTGIPRIGEERELLKSYYGRDGFAYAYRIPGMNKVLQAAGRVIRTTEDTGWILLLDERFIRPEYRNCFPPSWHDVRICTLDNIGEQIREFWLEVSGSGNSG